MIEKSFGLSIAIAGGTVGSIELTYKDDGSAQLRFGVGVSTREWSKGAGSKNVTQWHNFFLTSPDRGNNEKGEHIQNDSEWLYQYMYNRQIVVVIYAPAAQDGKPKMWEKGGYAETGFGGQIREIALLTGDRYKKFVEENEGNDSADNGASKKLRPKADQQPSESRQGDTVHHNTATQGPINVVTPPEDEGESWG